jgi:glycosyltransferase involved in cell wall biosynthesis
MRVLIVSAFHYPGDGVATYAFSLSELLRTNGHETAFFAMQDDRNVPDPNSDLFVSHIDFVELNRHKSLLAGLRVLGRIIYSPEARRKFGLMLDRFQPDLIHTQGFQHFMSPSILFEANRREIPVVHTLHDFKMVCPNTSMVNDRLGSICEACKRGRYYMPILKRCKKGSTAASAAASVEAYAHALMGVRRRISAYVAPSRFLLNKYIEHGFPAGKLNHIPNMLSDGLFSEQVAVGDYALFIGRVDPLKGVRELVQAAARVPEIPVKIAGRVAPTMADEVPSQLPPNVQYVGLKRGDELRDLVAGALVVVVPSKSYENQPFSVLEAFAAGKAVIASDLGGITELVAHKERGLLVRPGDVGELVDALRWICQNRDAAMRMGLNAQSYARTKHGAEVHYKRIIGLYSSVIDGCQRGIQIGRRRLP